MATSLVANDQALRALGVGNAQRLAAQALKRRVRSGDLTIHQLVGDEHLAVAGRYRMADVLDWGFPLLGPTRQQRVGRRAIREGINLLLPIEMTTATKRRRFADLVCEARSLDQRRVVSDLPEDADAEIRQLRRRLAAAGDAEAKLASLVDAVEAHRRAVSSPSSPGEAWALADETLWAQKDSIWTFEAELKAAA